MMAEPEKKSEQETKEIVEWIVENGTLVKITAKNSNGRKCECCGCKCPCECACCKKFCCTSKKKNEQPC